MVSATWDELVHGLDDEDRGKLEAYRKLVRSLGGVEERIHSAEIDFAVKRVFTSAYVKSHWLEIGIDLLREVTDHPHLRTSFASTKKVFTHRFTLASADQLKSLEDLLVEARDTVGPGTR